MDTDHDMLNIDIHVLPGLCLIPSSLQSLVCQNESYRLKTDDRAVG